jgi:hypothetical protein
MLEELLEIITLEKCLLFFKDQSLSYQAKEHHLVKREKNYLQFSDSEILKAILPEEFFKKMFREGHMTLLAFVFALRHKLTLLNLFFHAKSLGISEIQFLKDIEKKGFINIKDDHFENDHMLYSHFWNSTKHFPIIGFSSVGCLFTYRSHQTCRAFDHYEILSCSEKTENSIFCNHHQNEAFWNACENESASTQCKMFSFYLNKNNFKDYDEEKIKKLIDNFYSKFSQYYKVTKTPSIEVIDNVLNFYHYTSIQSVRESGIIELRKRFLEKAKELHPDVGGSQELFREARVYYETLRDYL